MHVLGHRKQLLHAIDELLEQLQNGLEITGQDEDIHSWVERTLKEKVGDLSSCIRIGRSRNDLVVTDFRLYVMAACDEMIELCRSLQKALWERASEDTETALPGYTHLQRT